MLRGWGPIPAALAIAGAGLAARIVAGSFLPHASWVSDELEYLGAAKMAAAGFGLGFYEEAPWLRPPGYIALVGAIFRLTGTLDGVYVLQAFLTSAATVAITLIAWETWGRAAGMVAGLLTNAYYPLIVYPNLLLAESLCLFLVSWGAWLALRNSRAGSVGTGIAFGLASLIRGLAGALALPVLTYYLIRRRWVQAGLLLLFWLAVQAPWVARNYVAYGALAQPDLTAGYNLWFAAEGLRGEQRLTRDLMAIANPLDRDRFAQAKALKAIAEDPKRYLAHGPKEAADLWLSNFSAEERLVAGFALGSVPPWHLALNFFLGDLLFSLMVGLALVGAPWRRHEPTTWLCLLWALFLTGAAFLVFATDRFRMLAIVPVAILASGGLVEVRRHVRSRLTWRVCLIAGMLVAPTLINLAAYPFDALRLGMSRWWTVQHLAQIRDWIRGGETARALQALRTLDVSFFETRLLRLQALAASGQQGTVPETPTGLSDLEAMAVGDLWRYLRRPDRAEQFLRSSQVASSDRTDWMWSRALAPPPSQLVLGTGMDVGFIKGFSRPERDGTRWFRWTRGNASAVLSAPLGRSRIIVAMAAYRPAGWPPVRVRLFANGAAIWEGQVGWPWQDVMAEVETVSSPIYLSIVSDTFVPGFGDKRELGVMVSKITLERY